MKISREDLSDVHLNQRRHFAGLPQWDAKELAQWRGYLRWMRSRFAPEPVPPPPATPRPASARGKDRKSPDEK